MTVIGLLGMGFITAIIFCSMGLALAQTSSYETTKKELTKTYSYALLVCVIGVILCLIIGNIIY